MRSEMTLDPDKIQSGCEEMMRSLDSIGRGQPSVIVIGITGSGKSTTVGYLRGDKIKKAASSSSVRTHYEVETPYTDVGQSAKIGHRGSQTTYPQAFSVKDSSVIMVDTAGFGDTRGDEVQVSIALGLQQLSQRAKINGMMVVLTQDSITGNRARDVRMLVNILSRLTSQLSADNLTFCVTATKNPDLEDDVIVRDLLESVRETAETMRAELHGRTLSAERKLECEQTIAALELMTEHNMFIMKNLEDPKRQEASRRKIIPRLESMTGMSQRFRVVMDEATDLRLLAWSKDIATKGLAQLQEIEKIRATQRELSDAAAEITRLKDRLLQSSREFTDADKALRDAEAQKAALNAQIQALLSEQDKLVATVEEFSVPIPRKGSGVSGLVSHQFGRSSGNPRFESLEAGPGVNITAQSAHDGSFTAVFSAEVTDRSDPTNARVRAIHKQKELPGFQQELRQAQLHLQALVAHEPDLLPKKRRTEHQLKESIAQIQAAANRLGFVVRADDDYEHIMAALADRSHQLEAELTTLHARRTDAEALMQPDQKYHVFLQRSAELLELFPKAPVLREFVRLYESHLAAAGGGFSLAGSNDTMFGSGARRLPTQQQQPAAAAAAAAFAPQ